jgi:hypothetical protein
MTKKQHTSKAKNLGTRDIRAVPASNRNPSWWVKKAKLVGGK